MLHTASIGLLGAGFFGAGLVNAMGPAALKDDFIRWGYPAWWCYLTGGLEVATAVLVAVPAGRGAGLALGAAIVAAAVLTVLRHRRYAHLAPLGVFVALLALAGSTVG